MDTLGSRIKLLRKTLKLNQTNFGSPIGVSYGHISNIENDKDIPSDTIIKLIAINYNVSEEWLRDGTGEMFLNTETCQENHEYKTTFICLDNIICESSDDENKIQIEILKYLTLLFANKNKDCQIELKKLNILKMFFKEMYNIDNALQTSTNRGEILLDGDVINDMLDDLFGKFTNLMYDYTYLFLENE